MERRLKSKTQTASCWGVSGGVSVAYSGLRSYTYLWQSPTTQRKGLTRWSVAGSDFADAERVFEGPTFEVQDRRRDYGEKRVICFGMLLDRMVVVGYTPRGADRHVFSMRKANDREQTRISPLLGE